MKEESINYYLVMWNDDWKDYKDQTPYYKDLNTVELLYDVELFKYDHVEIRKLTSTYETIKEGSMKELSEMYQQCPECHMKTLEVTAHCATCINCGYSLCGI
jgi:hypothetical protein